MADFNRNEVETVIAYVCKHNRFFIGKDEEVRKQLMSLIKEMLEYHHFSSRTMGFKITRNLKESFFAVSVETDLSLLDDCWAD